MTTKELQGKPTGRQAVLAGLPTLWWGLGHGGSCGSGLRGPPGRRRAQAQPGESPEWPRPLTCLDFSSGRGLVGGAGRSWKEEGQLGPGPRVRPMPSLGPGHRPSEGGSPAHQIQTLEPPPPGTRFASPRRLGHGPRPCSPGLAPAARTWEPGRVGWTWRPEAARNRAVSPDLTRRSPPGAALQAQDLRLLPAHM